MTRARRSDPNIVLGCAIGATVVGLSTAVMVGVGAATTVAALVLVLPVVLAGTVGGRPSALTTAAVAAAGLNLAFIAPHWTFKINSVDGVVAFVVFVAVAFVVGALVAAEADRRRAAERRTVEVEELHRQYEQAVAERQRLTEESHQLALLTRADEHRKALLRSVSHDLRTPLASIRALTSDLRAGIAYDEETRKELLEVVNDEAERLDRLVANLLSLSRIEAGALQPEAQAVPLDELVAEVLRRLGRLTQGLRVEIAIAADLPLVDGDYSQLDQVVSNLVENAARHSPPDGTIEIGARCSNDEVEVWVQDDGAGIGDGDGIFEPFRRGAGSTSSGVGLAICKAVVEAHGGCIGAADVPGHGARFWFTLAVHRE